MDDPQVVLRARVRELLECGAVNAAVGYAAGSAAGRVRPALIRCVDQVARLVLNERCVNNLAVYLTRPDVRRMMPVAMAAIPSAIKAAFVLMQEHQIPSDGLVLIGLTLPGAPGGSCCVLPQRTHGELLQWLRDNELKRELLPEDLGEIARLEAMTPSGRWRYWQEHFSRCIRCYACRQVCPLCYCERCVAEKNRPQWVETSPHGRGNLTWNLTRAFHLAGRCVGCGECERACPAGIPLMQLNRFLAREVRDCFGGYVPGYAFDGEQVFSGFRPDDPDEFFE